MECRSVWCFLLLLLELQLGEGSGEGSGDDKIDQTTDQYMKIYPRFPVRHISLSKSIFERKLGNFGNVFR